METQEIVALENGIGQLSMFSTVMAQCLKSMDGNVLKLQEAYAQAATAINGLTTTVEEHKSALKRLESESIDNRNQVEAFVRSTANLEQSLTAQIADSTANIHKELLIQRTGTKMDMNSMRTQLNKSLNDAVEKFSQQSVKSAPLPQITIQPSTSSGGANTDAINAIVERLYRLEHSIVLQENINELISGALRSDHFVQEQFDSLHDQVKSLESKLEIALEENKNLKSQVLAVTPRPKSSHEEEDEMPGWLSKINFIERREKRSKKPHSHSEESKDSGHHHETTQDHHDRTDDSNSNNHHHHHHLDQHPNQDEHEHHNEKIEHETEHVHHNHNNNINNNNNEHHEHGQDGNNHDDHKHEHHRESNQEHEHESSADFDEQRYQFVENFIEAYTLEESDEMFDRLTAVEDRLANHDIMLFHVQRLQDGIDELRMDMEGVQNRFMIWKSDQEGASSNPDRILLQRIEYCRQQWERVKEDLGYGLEIISDEDAEKEEMQLTSLLRMANASQDDVSDVSDSELVPSSGDANVDLLVPKLKDFFEVLKTSLTKFEVVNNSGTDTAYSLFELLDDITIRSDELIALDQQLKMDGRFGRTFDDVNCMDRTKSLKPRLIHACRSTYPILDENVDKITIRRRVEAIEGVLPKKAEKSSVLDMEHDLRKILGTKADQEELIATASKKASLIEVTKLKEQIFKQLENLKISGGGASYSWHDAGPESPGSSGSKVSSKEVTELQQRFELLLKHFQDLQQFCDVFVPREEVHEAMTAMLSEVKTLKASTVTFVTFKDALKLKADAEEVRRLISTLSSAVGNLNGRSETSIGHSKCLVCDKPVTSVTSPSRPSTNNNQLMYSKSQGALPEDMEGRVVSASNRMPSSTFVRMASKDPAVSAKEKAKVSADIAVLKSTLDLPPIVDSANSVTSSYKQRIRSSAGGGMGPGFSHDSR